MIEPARYEKVLVALDLSPVSDKLVEWLRSLKALGTRRIILVHVVDPSEYEHPISGYDVNALLNAAEKEAERRLRRYEAKLKELFDASSIVSRGWPATVISELAEKLSVDLIVAGSHGRSWFKSILLGSVSEELARTAVKPVLIVKDIVSYNEKGRSIVAKPLIFRRIVAAIDLSRPETCILRHSASIALSTGAEVFIVSVVRRKTASMGSRLDEYVEALRKTGLYPKSLILRGTTGNAIVDFAVRIDASLIIMGPPERGRGLAEILRGRTLSVVLRHSPSSVLICREQGPGATTT